jgi:hypothetical protein
MVERLWAEGHRIRTPESEQISNRPGWASPPDLMQIQLGEVGQYKHAVRIFLAHDQAVIVKRTGSGVSPAPRSGRCVSAKRQSRRSSRH